MIVLEAKYISSVMSGESMQQSYRALDRVAQDKDSEAQLNGIAVAKFLHIWKTFERKILHQ